MSEPQNPGNGDDPKAIAFCQRYLAEHPEAAYKEVRRQAWNEGLRVTRRTFSLANQGAGQAAPAAPPEGAEGEAPPEGGPGPEDSGQPAADHGRHQRWNDLFGGEAPAEEAPSGEEEGEVSSDESPTESARRALGLLSSPAAADEPRQNAVEFMASYLREKPEASYKEVREAAEQSGYTVSSATFGRAQAITGILDDDDDKQAAAPTRASGAAPAAGSESPRSPLRGRRRGRDPALLLEEFIDHWEIASGERSQFRSKLEEMLKVVERALEQK